MEVKSNGNIHSGRDGVHHGWGTHSKMSQITKPWL